MNEITRLIIKRVVNYFLIICLFAFAFIALTKADEFGVGNIDTSGFGVGANVIQGGSINITYNINQTIINGSSFNSTYNNLLNQSCQSGYVVNGTYPNGTFICTQVAGTVDNTNHAMINQSQNFTGTQGFNHTFYSNLESTAANQWAIRTLLTKGSGGYGNTGAIEIFTDSILNDKRLITLGCDSSTSCNYGFLFLYGNSSIAASGGRISEISFADKSISGTWGSTDKRGATLSVDCITSGNCGYTFTTKNGSLGFVTSTKYNPNGNVTITRHLDVGWNISGETLKVKKICLDTNCQTTWLNNASWNQTLADNLYTLRIMENYSFNSTYNSLLSQNCPVGYFVNGTNSSGGFICSPNNVTTSFNDIVVKSITLSTFTPSISEIESALGNPAMCIQTIDNIQDLWLNSSTGNIYVQSNVSPYPNHGQALGSSEYRYSYIYTDVLDAPDIAGTPYINLTNALGQNNLCINGVLYSSKICSSNGIQTTNCSTTVPVNYRVTTIVTGFHNGSTTFSYILLYLNNTIVNEMAAERAAVTNPTPFSMQYSETNTDIVEWTYNATIETRNKTYGAFNGRLNNVKIRLEVFKVC